MCVCVCVPYVPRLLRFARRGALVVTWDINQAANEETVALLRGEGHKAWGFTVDMADREAIYEAARNTKEEVPVPRVANTRSSFRLAPSPSSSTTLASFLGVLCLTLLMPSRRGSG